MTELICTNDNYPEDYLKVFAKWKIQYPREGEIVTLLRVEKLHKLKKMGLIVSPYDGQFIPDKAHGLDVMREVSFDKKRFSTLLGLELTDEILETFKKESKKELELVKIKTKEDDSEKIL